MSLQEKNRNYLYKELEAIEDLMYIENTKGLVRRACELMYKFNKGLKEEYFLILDKKFNKYTGIPKELIGISGFYYWTDLWDETQETFHKRMLSEPKSTDDMIKMLNNVHYLRGLNYQTVLDREGICFYYDGRYIFTYKSQEDSVCIVIHEDGTVELRTEKNRGNVSL